MEAWRKVLREGYMPLLSDEELGELHHAVRAKKSLELHGAHGRLIRGQTTIPIGLQINMEDECEAACLLGFPGMVCRSYRTVGDVDASFGELSHKIDNAVGDPGATRYLLNWYDDAPEEDVLRELRVETTREMLLRRYKAKLEKQHGTESVSK